MTVCGGFRVGVVGELIEWLLEYPKDKVFTVRGDSLLDAMKNIIGSMKPRVH